MFIVMRQLYSSIFLILLPFILFRLYWRGKKSPEYRNRWWERLAIYKQSYPKGVLWLHAVSVGETEAAIPLIHQLQKKLPEQQILITTTTPTGSSRVQSHFKQKVSHVYLPYDIPWIVKRFILCFKPRMAVFLEKEIWPNLFEQCHNNNIPIVIINARLSQKSAKGYLKIRSFIQPALDQVSWIACQTTADQQRFEQIGAPSKLTETQGNIKFDLTIDETLKSEARILKKQLFQNRFVWIIASTHAKEEAIFLNLYQELKPDLPDLLLVLVPRHPERFEEVALLGSNMNLNIKKRSLNDVCEQDTDVFLLDTLGELKFFYGCADTSFIGGSMVPIGGHNVLEAAAMHTPILFGPFMRNFQDIAENIQHMKGAIQCTNAFEIKKHLTNLYHNPALRQELADNAQQFLKKNQGATAKIAERISRMLSSDVSVF